MWKVLNERLAWASWPAMVLGVNLEPPLQRHP